MYKRGRTKSERQRLFLRAFREDGSIYHACRRAQVSRTLVYDWRRNHKFEARFQQAKKENLERLKTAIYKRAMKGSDTLAMFILKAAEPETYRDKFEIKFNETELNSAIEQQLAKLAAGSEDGTPQSFEEPHGGNADGVPSPEAE